MKRWPVIRHLRWAWALWSINYFWLTVLPNQWVPPNQTEAEALEAIWRGDA